MPPCLYTSLPPPLVPAALDVPCAAPVPSFASQPPSVGCLCISAKKNTNYLYFLFIVFSNTFTS